MFEFLKNKNNGHLVLIYHSSFSEKNKTNSFIHNITPKNILTQISFLSNFYNIVPIDNIFDDESKENKLSITFDDGYENLFDLILPELANKKIPSTVFLIGNSFNNKAFWREKITYLLEDCKLFMKFKSQYNNYFNYEMNYLNFFKDSKSYKFNSFKLDKYLDEFFINENIEIETNLLSDSNKLIDSDYIYYGNHTFNHYVLSTLSYQKQYEEIHKNQIYLNSLKLNTTKVFAFPFGMYTDYNDESISILNELGIDRVLLNNNLINDHSLSKLENSEINYLDRLTTSNNKYLFTYRIIKKLLNI